MSTLNEFDELQKLEKEFQEVFNNAFPNVNLSRFRYGTEERMEYSHFLIPPQNENLRGSNYYIANNLDFFHFTNINALQSIISSKTIRLYNLNNLNDPREYLFGGNLIPQDETSIEDAKDNSFILSMCQDISEMKRTEKFNMWRLYGDNGFGCLIKVSFVKSQPDDWHNFYLSKVHYGISSRLRIKKISNIIKKINQEKPHLGIDLGQLLCFHKSFLYKPEKEVRLLYDKREKRGISYTKFYDSNQRLEFPIIRTEIKNTYNPRVRYLELPIVDSNYTPIDSHLPVIKIGHVILGYRLKNQFSEIKDEIKNLFRHKLGYTPLITMSRLSDVFWGKDLKH